MADEKENENVPESPEIHFDPIVNLSLVEIKTMEEDEEILLNLHAKLFRYGHDDDDEGTGVWKERGTGIVKILEHKVGGQVRILMRRDKTLKICANHYICPNMELEPKSGSDRAWVWCTTADFADEESKEEVLAIRFDNAENAQKFKNVFDASVEKMKKSAGNESIVIPNGESHPAKEEEKEKGAEEEADELTGQLKDLQVSGADGAANGEGDKESKPASAPDGAAS